jgi:hypothetical protein
MLVKTDFDRYTPGKWRRKSVTFLGEDPAIPLTIRRVIRYPDTKKVVEAAVNSGSFPLPPPVFNSLEEKKTGIMDTLLDWSMLYSIAKFTLYKQGDTFKLSAVDQESKDSYFLTSPKWEHIQLALFSLTEGKVFISSPTILNIYNPFSAVAPFDTPSLTDFERVNNQAVGELKKTIAALEVGEYPGFMRGKVLSSYYMCIAELEKLGNVMGLLSTPITDDFENEKMEN